METIITEFIENVKKNIRFSTQESLDTKEGSLRMINRELETGLSSEELCHRYDRVTPESITRVARKYFPKDRESGRYVLMIRDPLKE